MSLYFLEVKKTPDHPGDHLAIKVFQNEEYEYCGSTFYTKVVEHYENLPYGLENSTGTRQMWFDKRETHYKRYYCLQDDYKTGYIQKIASDIVQKYPDYSSQYEAFVTVLSEMGIEEYSE